MELYAPAKINLSFEIKGRREDGYHEIETLIAPVSVSDRLVIEEEKSSEDIHFRCNEPSLDSEENLVVRAVHIFRNATKIRAGVQITLEKKIPHGAGLGGGSSDAATTLVGLNQLFRAGLSREDLLKLSARIGSDVPFFIFRGAAICRGRGEIVQPTQLPQQLALLLVKPDFGVSTPWAYKNWAASRELDGVKYRAQEFFGMRWMNDLERPVFEKFVFLAHLKKWLLLQPEVGAALLSGSGSTVFAVLRERANPDLAERIRADVDPKIWTYSCEMLS